MCVLTRRFSGGSDSSESSPYETVSRGALSAPSLVTPARPYLRRSQEEHQAQMRDRQVKALRRKARQLGLEVTEKTPGGAATAEASAEG